MALTHLDCARIDFKSPLPWGNVNRASGAIKYDFRRLLDRNF